jgi:hypothetical protein
MKATERLGRPPFRKCDGTVFSDLEDRYRGRAGALICGGPSFQNVDASLIRGSGMVTMALNNSIRSYRSDLWLGVDPPLSQFDPTLWADSRVLKFIPERRVEEAVTLGAVNVAVYKRCERWCSEVIFDPSGPIADSRRGDGGRTSMVDAIRVLFLLGVRKICLFGVDFHQSRSHGYHYPVPGYERRIAANNRLYERMTRRLARMRPIMEAAGLRIFNCNPDSHLEVFEKIVWPDGQDR